MLPEVKSLLVSPFISDVVFKVDPDYTTQHIIAPKIHENHNCPEFNEASDAVKAEIYGMRIVQEPAHLDDLETPKVYFRLVVNDTTVATMITPPYDDILYCSVMVCFRFSLQLDITCPYSQPHQSSIDRFLQSPSYQ